MKKIIVALVVLAALVVAAYLVWRRPPGVEPGVIKVSGNIEATTVELSFRIPGWVRTRDVDEGWPVKVGQVVARLDNTELDQTVKLRQAESRQAEAALAELENGSRPEDIAQAEAAMKKADWFLKQLLAGSRPDEIKAAEQTVAADKADAERVGSDFERASALYEGKAITEQEFTAAKAALDVAKAKLAAAEAQYRLVRDGPRAEEIDQARAASDQARAYNDLVRNGPRTEDIDQARARVDQASGNLDIARTTLGYATLLSPLDGMVLSKSTEPGEYVSPGTPIVTAADLVNIWLRAYVSETDITKVHLGQKVTVKTDAYPAQTYEGRISFISKQAEFTPKTVQTEKERVKLVFRIKIDITNRDTELKPGMPADGYIECVGKTTPERRPTNK